ncbi:rhomboid family intramembrane serine protease [Tumidithrix elongata RA019]|uniref:Rhomboid family intramembrane serine protease n=1 Tax=Tumidithrix elongata BACA0141 TaxID=2716417 RepID=A0AAW9PUZ9_9CYAN|nr:rhomboid family intramembrane serine protease [Tumidithrix elongata RA019]
MRQKIGSLGAEIKTQATILGGFVAIIWALEIVDVILRGSLDYFGILPRTIVGLRGILFAPFLHVGFAHVAANTVPFLILGWLVMLRGTKDFFAVSIISAFISGAGTWAFGRPAIHIGASGMIFGYLGYLLFRGYFERSIVGITLSIVVGMMYGGLIFGVLPGQVGISWEGHLFGFIGGAIAAKLLTEQKGSSEL